MKQLELENIESFEEKTFGKSDVQNVKISLSSLIINFYNAIRSGDYNEQKNILQLLIKKHKISYSAFHKMRREHIPSNKYWVSKLNKTEALKEIALGKIRYPTAKCRFLKFTFDDKDNAHFQHESVGRFEFDSGLSCYHEILLEYIIKEYDEVYLAKGKNDLPGKNGKLIILEGKEYNGKFTVAMLKCKLKKPNGSLEKDKFDYFDVVHDPGGNCGDK